MRTVPKRLMIRRRLNRGNGMTRELHRLPSKCLPLLLSMTLPAFAESAVTAVDPIGTGSYRATMIELSALPDHTIYRPVSLQPFSAQRRLPVVLWANGGCIDAGNSARAFLTEVASHGYLVIASGAVRELPPVSAPASAPAPGQPVGPAPGAPGTQSLSKTSQLGDALDWVIAESKQRGSVYFDRIDAGKVAVMGVSCGGLQALEFSPDPRITTTVAWSSGLLEQPRAGANVTRADLQRLHAPVLYVVGGDKDIALPSARRDFGEIGVPIVLAQNAAEGHGGTLSQADGGTWAAVGVAWLDWQLKGNRTAAREFVGEQCVLCVDPAWKIQKKKID